MAGKKKIIPLTRKVNFVILLSLILGFGGIIAFLSNWILLNIENSVRANLEQQSEILYKTIENFMMPGDAPRAVDYFGAINDINPSYSIMVYRADGSPAFFDNATLRDVNTRLGRERFPLRSRETDPGARPMEPEFSRSVAIPPDNVFFEESGQGRSYYRIYKPLINLPKCTSCHGGEHTIRGVVDIRNDISSSVSERSLALLVGIGSFLLLVGAISFGLTLYLRADIIRPVKIIGQVCSQVTAGDFSARVTLKNRDEIGDLGATVNDMVVGLRERFQLSKYVSGSTIKSLQGEEKGVKQELTIFFSDIRGFTSYSEGKAPEEIVERLNGLLSFQTDCIHEEGGDVDKYVGDEIVAVYRGPDAAVAACRSALRIQAKLGQSPQDFGGLTVGIGINHGPVIQGMVGSQKRADFTVIGDTVNTASRLCGAAKKGQIIISESVSVLAKDEILTEGPFRLSVKGKAQPLRVFILQAIKAEGSGA